MTQIKISQRYTQRPHILLLDSQGILVFEFHDHALVQALETGRETLESCRRSLQAFALFEGYLTQVGDQFYASYH